MIKPPSMNMNLREVDGVICGLIPHPISMKTTPGLRHWSQRNLALMAPSSSKEGDQPLNKTDLPCGQAWSAQTHPRWPPSGGVLLW